MTLKLPGAVTFIGRVARIGVAVTALAGVARAQDVPPVPVIAAPAPAGFDVHGNVEAGYRFTDVTGSSDTYRQLIDLSDGLRLTGFDLEGRSKTPGRGFADVFSASASGFGGDPFAAVQVVARKSGVYDFRVNWRKSRFFDVSPLTPPSIAGLDTRAVTDNHGWNTSRQIGNASITLHATSHLHLLFELRPDGPHRRARFDPRARFPRFALGVGLLRPRQPVSGRRAHRTTRPIA